MHSLQGILNPREEQEHEKRWAFCRTYAQDQRRELFSSHSEREVSPRAAGLAQAAAANILSRPSEPPLSPPPRYYAYYLSHRGIHEAHIGCPSSLSCLVDLDTESTTDSIETLVRCAILGSAGQQSSVDDILSALQGKYPFYRNADRERTLKVCKYQSEPVLQQLY